MVTLGHKPKRQKPFPAVLQVGVCGGSRGIVDFQQLNENITKRGQWSLEFGVLYDFCVFICYFIGFYTEFKEQHQRCSV